MKTKEQLISDHMGLAVRLANRHRKGKPKNVRLDDLISDAYLGLVKAANAFDPTRGSFSTYATHKIVGAMRCGIRERDHLTRTDHAKGDIHVCSLGEDSQWHSTFNGYRGSRAYFGIDSLSKNMRLSDIDVRCSTAIESMDEWVSLIRPVSFQGRKALSLIYRDGLSRKEAGREMGLSESRVLQITAEARKSIRMERTPSVN